MQTILYIEKNDFNQRLVQKILGPEGFRVVHARDGMQGLKIAGKIHPALILMDLNLPQMDGLSIATKMKSVPELAQTPIVALSSVHSRAQREKAIVAGCDGYIIKPIDVSQFPKQIRNYMEGLREVVHLKDQSSLLKDVNINLVDQLQAKVEELEVTNKQLKANKEELLLAYEQSQKWNQELQRLNQLKENIVAITSHELRTPLSIAMGYIDMMLEDMLGPLAEEQGKVLNIAKHSLSKMSDLIDRITDLTRIALKKFPVKLQEFDLNEAFQSVFNELSYFIKIRGQNCTMELPEQPCPVMADRNLISQVFSNLVKNAICFTPDSGTITIRSWLQEKKVFFSVQDTGVGLKEEDLKRIFDGFYQVHDVKNHKTGQFEYMTRGIGVGLALCKGILNELGGKIWAESSGLHKGSTFTFYLPLVIKA